MKKPFLINVVSGKGGTGKSLLCAVLGRLLAQESARVLLVDFDLFVRGLTHFHYRYIKERRIITEAMSVANLFGLVGESVSESILAKERFFEVDLIPAVSEIETQLDYLEVADKSTIEKTRSILTMLHEENEYDYIIVDNRAGVDEIILETSREADISLAVAESDPISRTTNENLLRHLRTKKVGKVYTVINKVKFLRSLKDYEAAIERISGDFDVVGQIPFDLELFETFGTAQFWDRANSTRYGYALAECWNKVSKREELETTISMARFANSGIWPSSSPRPSLMTRIDRLMLLAGMLMLFGYYFYDSLEYGFELKDIFLLYAIVLMSAPFVRRFLFPADE